MIRDRIFISALLLSASLHFVLFASGGFFNLPKDNRPETQIEVTYVVTEPLNDKNEKILQSLPKKYDLKRAETKLKKSPPQKSASAEAREVTENEAALLEKSQQIEAENLEEYIAYYKLLREKIKTNVNRYYARASEEGEVYVVFSLGRDGTLKKILIDEARSAPSRFLKDVALKSVKNASPFPAFPGKLKRDELIFSIAIIFKKG